MSSSILTIPSVINVHGLKNPWCPGGLREIAAPELGPPTARDRRLVGAEDVEGRSRTWRMENPGKPGGFQWNSCRFNVISPRKTGD